MIDFHAFADEMTKIALGFRARAAGFGAVAGGASGGMLGTMTGGPEGEPNKTDWRDVGLGTLIGAGLGAAGGAGYGQVKRTGALNKLGPLKEKKENLEIISREMKPIIAKSKAKARSARLKIDRYNIKKRVAADREVKKADELDKLLYESGLAYPKGSEAARWSRLKDKAWNIANQRDRAARDAQKTLDDAEYSLKNVDSYISRLKRYV